MSMKNAIYVGISVREQTKKYFQYEKVSKPSPPSRRNPPAVPADGQQPSRHRMEAAKKRTIPCREREAWMRHKKALQYQLQLLQLKKKVSDISLSTYN